MLAEYLFVNRELLDSAFRHILTDLSRALGHFFSAGLVEKQRCISDISDMDPLSLEGSLKS